ncbi:MAG: FtsX-like permease family protein [Acidimicrobiales bacterium]
MTAVLDRPRVVATTGPSSGGMPARRAVVRWAWRLFRREWRQQMLVLALIVVAVTGTFIGSAVAKATPPPVNAGFGTAQFLANFQNGSSAQISSDVVNAEQRLGTVDVIENQTMQLPGSITTFELRAQNPHGLFGTPLLSLVSGRYPVGLGEVALTADLASEFGLRVGGRWREGGMARRVVGLVENPQSLLDSFALVAPGQVSHPTQATVLFDAHGKPPRGLPIESASMSAGNNGFNPDTIVLALATLGMLLIALVAIGGFSVLAQRRLRSIGMLESLGARDKHVSLVIRANGVIVGVVGAVLGAALGLAGWLAYRPFLQSSAHHVIGTFQIPWIVVGPSMGLAVIATSVAAARPARAITRVPIVAALAGRPSPPKEVRRSAVPGSIAIGVAFVLLAYSGSTKGNGGGALELVLGFVALVVGIVFLSPLCLGALSRFGRRAPVAVRLALRDLSRYRSRSGAALAAISLGILVAVVVVVVAAARYGNTLDYVGPNLASNQFLLYTPNGDQGPGSQASATPVQLRTIEAKAKAIAASVGAKDFVELLSPSANLNHNGPGRNFTGQIYVETPGLLKAFGIDPTTIEPSADVLTARPGLAGVSQMQLIYGNIGKGQTITPGSQGPNGPNSSPCPPGSCLANPVIQEVGALPAGTSAPNTVLTQHAVRSLHLLTANSGWLVQTAAPLTAAQLTSVRLAAASAGLSTETKNDEPTSSEIVNWATVFGVAMALAILAMTIGLIRSETASDRRTLTAAGAGSRTRRTITAATAGALALIGAVVGTVGGYLASIGFFVKNSLEGLGSLGNVPVANLLVILVGTPLVAAAAAWLLSGRQPPAVAHQPLE